MNDDETGCFLVFLEGCLLLAAFSFGHWWASSGHKAEAVKAGAARYEVNPQTGQTRFVYLKPGLATK